MPVYRNDVPAIEYSANTLSAMTSQNNAEVIDTTKSYKFFVGWSDRDLKPEFAGSLGFYERGKSSSGGVCTIITYQNAVWRNVRVDNNRWGGWVSENCFPIGSIIITETATNPSSYYGGVWARLIDFFPWATSASNFGTTGGASTVTLTANQSGLRSHNHQYVAFDRNITTTDQVAGNGIVSTQNPYNKQTSNEGGWNASEAHNNMPPYRQMAFWKRTT